MSDLTIDAVSLNDKAGIHLAKKCDIKVLGIGGGGGNTLQHMINQSLSGVEFIAINTDAQALNRSTAPLKVQIGVKLTNGLGAGCDPNKGRKAAEESREDIKKLLQGSNLVFITAGMGGGTGTGAAPIIAEIAQETGALTIAVVTKPFTFEGKRHMVNAEAGITELTKHVDSIIVIENDKLLKNLGANISLISAFNEANDVLLNAVKGITDSINYPGFINLDYSDIKTITKNRGHAMIGNGVGKGANFVEDAVQRAIHSPLIEQVDVKSATGLLVNARVNPNFPMDKWYQINKEIQNYADEEADCKYGIIFDDQFDEDQIYITILITGISVSDPSNVDASKARNNANMRRNATINHDNSFFKLSQQGQMPINNNMPMQAQAGQNVAFNQQAMRMNGQNGVPMQAMSMNQAQMQAQGQTQVQGQAPIPMNNYNANVGGQNHNMNYAQQGVREVQIQGNNQEAENWDVPSILRKKI